MPSAGIGGWLSLEATMTHELFEHVTMCLLSGFIGVGIGYLLACIMVVAGDADNTAAHGERKE